MFSMLIAMTTPRASADTRALAERGCIALTEVGTCCGLMAGFPETIIAIAADRMIFGAAARAGRWPELS